MGFPTAVATNEALAQHNNGTCADLRHCICAMKSCLQSIVVALRGASQLKYGAWRLPKNLITTRSMPAKHIRHAMNQVSRLFLWRFF